MKRSLWVLLLAIVAAGCAGTSSTTTSAPSPVNAVPAGVKLTGTPLGEGLRVGDYAVWLTSADAPRRGAAQLDAVVVDQNDQPVADATVSFDIDMTNMSHGKNVIKTDPLGDGHYAGEVHFMMGGPWRVIVIVERANQAPVSARFNFNVK
ncbi:MAG TPA: FixH family protein [Anaerolineae bacterium]|nr:FixH family protein [Anaerolineae bacterium]